jgi:ribosomal-protein-alanine N-acetyltransferase
MNEEDIDNVYSIETTVHIAPWSKNILRDCVLVGYNCLILETHINHEWATGGYAICRHKNGYCHLLNFCIAKHLQGKGFGRKFLKHVLARIDEDQEVAYITLEVRPSNKVALHLYETLGFKISEIKKSYYTDNEYVEDAIVLKKELRG